MQWKEGRILKMDYNKNDDPFLLKVPKKFMEEALQVLGPILCRIKSPKSGHATGLGSISHCYLSYQRFDFCFETFHARLLSRWSALFEGSATSQKN